MNNYIIRKKAVCVVVIDGVYKNVYFMKDFNPMEFNKFPKDFIEFGILIEKIKKSCNCKNVTLINIIHFEDEYIEVENIVKLQETLEIK